VCSETPEVWAVKVECNANATAGVVNVPHHECHILSRGFSLIRWLGVLQHQGLAMLYLLPNNTQDVKQNYHIFQVEPRNSRNRSIYISSSQLHLHSLIVLYSIHHQHPGLPRHHMTCVIQRLSFHNTADILHNFVMSLCPSFRHIQLYHNPNTSDVYSHSIFSDGPNWLLQEQTQATAWAKMLTSVRNWHLSLRRDQINELILEHICAFIWIDNVCDVTVARVRVLFADIIFPDPDMTLQI